MAANRGLFTLDWVVAVAACVALQLICTLDYSSITTLTNDVMASHRAFFADTNVRVDASVRRAATRAHAPRLARAAPYLACGDASVEAWSARTVSHGAVGVAATATSTPAPGGRWTYRVEFSNSGEATVQLLTRRLTFVNARGEARGDAGPGASGSTRVLGPGETWAYESAASLTTPSGSFYGTFVFEILKLPPGGGAAFYAGASLSLSLEKTSRASRLFRVRRIAARRGRRVRGPRGSPRAPSGESRAHRGRRRRAVPRPRRAAAARSSVS